jgi:ComF family protein
MAAWLGGRVRRGMNWLGSEWRDFWKVVFAGPCPLCQRSTPQPLCRDCDRKLQQSQTAIWVPGAPPIFAWAPYGGEVKRAIAALKYENQPQLARPLGQWLGQAWLDSSANTANILSLAPWVVPVPLHSTRLQERGFNQAELLAEQFCAVTGLRLVPQGLARAKATSAQFQLSPTERERNLTQAFTIHPSLLRRSGVPPILLVDDIYTTGATVREVVQTCRRQGIRVCGVVVLAKA